MGVLYARVGGAWVEVGGQAGGVTDHGTMTGLADDDHPQYKKVGAAPKHHVTVAVLGSTPMTGWTQMNFGGSYQSSGTLTVQANPGGIYITEAGYYAASWTAMSDRTLNNLYMNIKYGAQHAAFLTLLGSTAGSWRYNINCVFSVAPADINQWVTINATTPTACWLGGQLAADDRFTLSSLF